MDGQHTDVPEDAYHYNVIRRALDEIDVGEAPLSLDALAERIGMSPAHFQRIFSQWVGVSPKRYQQYLAVGQAREMLRARHTTLATADAVGLSGSGRLHDLFVRWEAMAPGDYAKGGAGLTIRWGWFESPFGPALVMGTEKGICGIGFASETGPEPPLPISNPVGRARRSWRIPKRCARWRTRLSGPGPGATRSCT